MVRKTWLNVLLLIGVASGLAACATTSTPHQKTARIMEQDKTQLALLLNDDFSLTVVGVGAGERVKPCDPATSRDRSDPKAAAEQVPGCDPRDHGTIIFEETYKVTVVEGSCCAYVSSGGTTVKYCSPPFPLAFVKGLGQCK